MIANEIGSNAGKIWNFLNEHEEQLVKNLMRKLKLSGPDFYMAIGWLAREGKISHFEQEGVMKVRLK